VQPDTAPTLSGLDWPAHTSETRAWHQTVRAGTREDRTLKEIRVSLPPNIADLEYNLQPDLRAESERVAYHIAFTEGAAGDQLGALGRFLIQTESVSSSKIEQVDATTEDFARAIAGSRANGSAVSMVAATTALTDMVAAAGRTRTIDLDEILDAHRILMRHDPHDGKYAGRLRVVQNWILGSDYSPRGAVHIPPPPETVAAYMRDLLVYANRYDVPPLVQAAVVHAQFESIHPFTDGNGRIGRALINAVLRRRGVTQETVVPIATALVAKRDEYFRLINDYRGGHLGPFIRSLVSSATIAVEESRHTAERFRQLPAGWLDLVQPRTGSAGAALIHSLLEHPVLDIEGAMAIAGTSAQAVYSAMDRLTQDGIVREITGRARDRVWAATEVMAELDDLSRRIAVAVRAKP
jgi:Fic family protein